VRRETLGDAASLLAFTLAVALLFNLYQIGRAHV